VPTAPSGVLFVGANVQIAGTGGDGLRLREGPSLNGQILFLAYEGEIYQVMDGPQDVDGYTWWYLIAPYDEKVQGWAVANFLAIVQNP
jgi:hypothetical protein